MLLIAIRIAEHVYVKVKVWIVFSASFVDISTGHIQL
jgi:hypothetical protein